MYTNVNHYFYYRCLNNQVSQGNFRFIIIIKKKIDSTHKATIEMRKR